MDGNIFANQVLWTGLLGWFLAQLLKPFVEYLIKRRWNWGLWFSAGGNPSSHSALMTSTTLAIGLYVGFGTPLFALAVAISMIVVYDAAGVRRQAGMQAARINRLFEEMFAGHPITEKRLKEVLGHTPRQVFTGILLGAAIAMLMYVLWPPIR
ncbi:divergent PAP2 family protein [bacterium]|nr:MAG: divergent PAP2 family protein [bacterium]